MPVNTSPIFTITPVIGIAQISTANTNRDGTGTIASILTGGTYGTRLSRITIKAVGTTTAGMVRLFISDDSETPNIRLWREIQITAVTPSATVPAFAMTLSFTGEFAFVLPQGYSLQASTERAETFNVIAEGGDF